MDERRARVIGEDRISKTETWTACWHCHGTTTCDCIFCGKPGQGGQWTNGSCSVCKGTGCLTTEA